MHNFVISFAGSEGFANQEVREGWGRGRDGVGELEAARDSSSGYSASRCVYDETVRAVREVDALRSARHGRTAAARARRCQDHVRRNS